MNTRTSIDLLNPFRREFLLKRKLGKSIEPAGVWDSTSQLRFLLLSLKAWRDLTVVRFTHFLHLQKVLDFSPKSSPFD